MGKSILGRQRDLEEKCQAGSQDPAGAPQPGGRASGTAVKTRSFGCKTRTNPHQWCDRDHAPPLRPALSGAVHGDYNPPHLTPPRSCVVILRSPAPCLAHSRCCRGWHRCTWPTDETEDETVSCALCMIAQGSAPLTQPLQTRVTSFQDKEGQTSPKAML